MRARSPAEGGARIEVANETTLQGITRLIDAGPGPVGVLNFASARNPGGGFQSGSQAQEESLARSSGLHASLMSAWQYYERNRGDPSLLYSDAIIYSPCCPVFRDDSGALLAKPHFVTFLSCAAPNAGAVRENQPTDAPLIEPALRRRGEGVLALAATHGLRSLVLGAWGCGVFRNDPALVAQVFRDLLLGESHWARHFARVIFSVYDASPARDVLRAFERVFAADAAGPERT